MTARLNEMMRLNPEFAKAVAKGESWAVQRADEILALDGFGSRQFLERRHDEDGIPKNHCGSCPYTTGCMTCDLPHNPEIGRTVRTVDDSDNPFAPFVMRKKPPVKGHP